MTAAPAIRSMRRVRRINGEKDFAVNRNVFVLFTVRGDTHKRAALQLHGVRGLIAGLDKVKDFQAKLSGLNFGEVCAQEATIRPSFVSRHSPTTGRYFSGRAS